MYLQIQIYKPNNGKGCGLSQQPPPVPPLGSVHLKHFTLEALPRKHWRKYSYAALFVSNIRAKTPKVTLYTQRAKFQVMENEDVEVTFYDGERHICTLTSSHHLLFCSTSEIAVNTFTVSEAFRSSMTSSSCESQAAS